jgi:subtilase family serine protease
MLRRMREYAASGANLAPDPASGVYARGNSADLPALRPDGSVEPTSISKTLADRGLMQLDVEQLREPVTQAHLEIAAAEKELDSNAKTVPVPDSAQPGRGRPSIEEAPQSKSGSSNEELELEPGSSAEESQLTPEDESGSSVQEPPQASGDESDDKEADR